MLLLNDEEVRDLITVDMCLESLEQAYRELGNSWAGNSHRWDIVTADPNNRTQDSCHRLKSMMGSVSGAKVAAIRINSDVITWPSFKQGIRMVKVPKASGERYVGLVLLFSLETGEMLSLFPDASIQRMRVGTSCALGAKYLSRQDAVTMGMYGSGWQAGSHLMAMTKVRAIKTVRVYSPNQDRCKAFCHEMEPLVNAEIVPVRDPEDVMRSADIVIGCTNSLDPVIHGKLLEEGMYLSSVKAGELDQAAYDRCDMIVIHGRQLEPVDILVNGGRSVPEGLTKERKSYLPGDFKGIEWEKLPELSHVIQGKIAGRESLSQIICFCNNMGMGIQFAAVGEAVYRKALAHGKGMELPSEWFSQIHHS